MHLILVSTRTPLRQWFSVGNLFVLLTRYTANWVLLTAMSTSIISSSTDGIGGLEAIPPHSHTKPALPLKYKIVMFSFTCSCAVGNYWSSGIIAALKTTIEKQLGINDSQFATLVTVMALINTILSLFVGCLIDKFGGPLLLVILVSFCCTGSIVQAATATEKINSYSLLMAGRVIAALGQGSLDIAQHKIFATYFAPGKGFAVSMGMMGSIAILFHFVGQSTANVIAKESHSYSWTLWISAFISFWSFLSSVAVISLDKYLRAHYNVIDEVDEGEQCKKTLKTNWRVVRKLPFTFWIVTLFAAHQSAGMGAFMSISTQYAQQRLRKSSVTEGWVSSFCLLLPICIVPLEGLFIDMFGHRIALLLISAISFFLSIVLLFSNKVQALVCAHVFYAVALCSTAPQVELVRNIIPDPQFYATASAIRSSIVEASTVIFIIAAGMIQETSPTQSLEGTLTIWFYCSIVSLCLAGILFAACHTELGKKKLPAARLAEVRPHDVEQEVERLWTMVAGRSVQERTCSLEDKESRSSDDSGFLWRQKEFVLRNPIPGKISAYSRGWAVGGSVLIILGAWIMFGIGIVWGLRASVIRLATQLMALSPDGSNLSY
ncbi:hypothetical protein SCLCIDRAFT_865222 [Scleroderma citrinum Foug A]|uniref:Lysosomal dipeptide transporter MFSD1 n=1 Tax=Scleroderma citrinum Foug A TaxID=1036808 RepID=A0A0C3A9Y2_9AGAM|nr:hypothetical protein SCLCIDRAFT_865222 [Scleroderma citrinum Foug A]